MKKKTLKFTQFDKDRMLELHKPRDLSQESRANHLAVADNPDVPPALDLLNPYDDEEGLDSDYDSKSPKKQSNA